MAQVSSDTSGRPKGILKNKSTNESAISPTIEGRVQPSRELTEREITQMNTDANAGISSHRRSSSNPRGSMSRRQSSGTEGQDGMSARLKWDEANLYLNEGQMGGKMKIDEPKTPFAGHYNPLEDEDEETDAAPLNPDEIVVDELDKAKSKSRHVKSDDIPGLDLGEPELHAPEANDGEKRVMVDLESTGDDEGRHGEDTADMTSEELEKHRKFEQMRKKHYEMKNVKDLLAHAPDDDDDEDEDD